MTMLEEIESKAIKLPLSERGHLVHDLLMTLDQASNDSDAYEKEIQKRIKSIKFGSAKGTPVDQVFSLVENKYA
jgi:putative addiction module component (TIGR02574 family)